MLSESTELPKQKLQIIEEILKKCSANIDSVLDSLLPNKKDDGVLFFDTENVPTELLLGIISKASEIMMAELDSDENVTTEDLINIENNKMAMNLISKNYEKTLLALIERARYQNVIEHGGYDALMEGYINKTPQIGKDTLKLESDKIIREAKERDKKVSMVYGDLDKFKLVNDGYGHLIGDLTLAHVASCVSQVTKKGDIKVRDGGEEIFVILDDADKNTACATAERIRQSVEANPLYAMYVIQGVDEDGKEIAGEPIAISPLRYQELIDQAEERELKQENGRGTKTTIPDKRSDGRIVLIKIPLSLSMGVAEFPDYEDGVVLRTKSLADAQMYKAKDEGGRNCVYYNGRRVTPLASIPIPHARASSDQPETRPTA